MTSSKRSMANIPAADRRTALLKVLRQAGAIKASTALPIGEAAERLKYTKFDVYGLVCGTSGKAGSAPRCLARTGHVKVTKSDEGGLAIYLSSKGRSEGVKKTPAQKSSRSPEAGANGST